MLASLLCFHPFYKALSRDPGQHPQVTELSEVGVWIFTGTFQTCMWHLCSRSLYHVPRGAESSEATIKSHVRNSLLTENTASSFLLSFFKSVFTTYVVFIVLEKLNANTHKKKVN